MQQTILNLLTTCMTDVKATTADLKVPASPVGDSPFGALLSQAMDEGSLQGAASGVAQVKSSAPLALQALLLALLGEDVAASGQTAQTTAGTAALQTASDEGSLQGAASGVAQVKSSAPLALPALLLAFLGEDVAASGQTAQTTAGTAALQTASDEGLKTSAQPAGGSMQDEGTAAGTNLKAGQQLQNLIMGLLALVMAKEAGAGGQTAAATGSDSGEEKATAEQGNGITTNVKDGGDDGPSHRSKASSNSGASSSAPQTDNQHLLDTLALLLFTGLETIRGEPGKESGTSGETQSLLAKDGGTERVAAAAQPATGGQAAENADMLGRETVASPGDELKGFAARILDAGTDAAASTGTAAVRAEFALTPAGKAGGDENSLTLQISVGNAGASGQTSLAGQTAGSVQDGAAAGVKGAGSASHDGVVTIVKELTPLILEGRDGNTSHNQAAGKESPGAKESYPITLDEHVSMNDESTQAQQVSGQPGSTLAIERFDRVMEQVGSGTGQHDMTVRLTVGNDESLVLALKDLGQTVTVEVRGSNQGMINLLQSQRDVIISHLEGKDISANLVIDPNASGTPEKRDRRETRQGTSAARAKAGGGFDGLLEIFA